MKKNFTALCILLAVLCLFPAGVLAADPLAEVRELIQDRYVLDVGKDILNKTSIGEMVDALKDPYSTYITPEDLTDYLATLDGEYVGVGMIIEQVGKACQVVSPIPGSPAEEAGVQSGDIIIKINGQSVVGLLSGEVVGKIRGPEGTKVSVTVRRGSKAVAYQLIRQTIRISSVEYYQIGPSVGYVKLSGFNSESTAEMEMALDKLTNENVQEIVLDLRDNPGGLLDVAVSMAGEFVPVGPVVHVIQKGNKEYTLKSFRTPRGLPVAVLVNGNTASAGEILAGAIQDSKEGKLIGTKTFGKGCVQTIIPLSNDGALKLTTALYLTRDRHEVNLIGITPDIVEADESKQLPVALESLGKDLELYDLVVSLDSSMYFAGSTSGSLPTVPYLKTGSVMVPLRSAAVSLGGTVLWKDGRATVKTASGTFTVTPQSNGELRRGNLMVPLRLLTDKLGLKATWHQENQSVSVAAK